MTQQLIKVYNMVSIWQLAPNSQMSLTDATWILEGIADPMAQLRALSLMVAYVVQAGSSPTVAVFYGD